MKTIAIMQPTYLPWLGYFDLFDTADEFVILDTVQFSYQSWQHRNRILLDGQLRWLTVPVRRKGRMSRRIDEIEIGESTSFPDDHIRLIEEAYQVAPHFEDLEFVAEHLRRPRATPRLIEVTLPLLLDAASLVGITTPVCRASDLSVSGRRSELLVRICEHLRASRYLTPVGAVDYLREDRALFDDAGIELVVQSFEHPTYRQLGGEFVAYASVVDLIAMEGKADTLARIRNGRHAPVSLG